MVRTFQEDFYHVLEVKKMSRIKTVIVESPGEGSKECEIKPGTTGYDLRDKLGLDKDQNMSVKGRSGAARNLPSDDYVYDYVRDGDVVQTVGDIELGYF